MNITFNPEKTKPKLLGFISDSLAQTGLEGVVIGLSGGIDSALSATLAVEALGKEKVFGLMMPYRTSSPESISDAQAVIAFLGIEHKLIEITPMIEAYFKTVSEDLRIRAGNKMARERMSILFDQAHAMKRLVLGTGNRTEIALGYTTLYGDAACSINPLGHLYKTEVRALARHLGIPDSVITKPPSADLWSGQTDEGEIGVTYEQIDRLLVKLLDEGVRDQKQLLEDGLTPADIERVLTLINRNAFKRQLPPIASLGRADVPNSISISE